MARMFPEEYRESADGGEAAEALLYRELAARLPDDYLVFHRRPWHAPSATGTAPDGEADFVVAHASRGILVLEAEAGAVARDPATGEWHALDVAGGGAAGPGRPIDDPVQQAVRRKRALAARLGELPAGAGRDWSIGHAVAFPQAQADPAALGLAPPLVLQRDDLPRLAAWTEAALAHWAARAPASPPGPEGVALLLSLLGVGLRVRPLLGCDLAQQELELARLTAEQFRVLDGLARFRRALICGCAGSGKTLLALEKVRRLAEQGQAPLYLCYNVQLRDSCRRHLAAWPRATADNFHELCTRWARKAGVPVVGPREDERVSQRDFFDRVLPAALLEAARRLPGDRYDAIVVDEAQDFHSAWWGPLQATLRDPRAGVLYLHYDDNQMLYREELLFPPVDTRYDLSENCRNLRQIHDLVMRYCKVDRRITSRAPRGERPEVRVYRSPEELLAAVTRTLVHFTQDLGIAPRDLAVLTGHGKEKSAIWGARKLGEFALTTDPAPRAGEVFWSSVHAFKGLERAAVVLAEIEPTSKADLETLLYVGCSRARLHLAVIVSQGVAGMTRLEGAAAHGRPGGR